MQTRVVRTNAKTLKLRNAFIKHFVKVEDNKANLRVDSFYTDENNNFYYCFAGNDEFMTFDKTKNINFPLFNINIFDLKKIDEAFLKQDKALLLLFSLDIDKKYYEKYEKYILQRIKNAR